VAIQDMTQTPAVSWEKPQAASLACLQLMLLYDRPPRWSRRPWWSVHHRWRQPETELWRRAGTWLRQRVEISISDY